jgi:hypothetical protein
LDQQSNLKEIIADTFEILIDRHSLEPVVAVKVNPVEGEPFALPMEAAARALGNSLVSAARIPERQARTPAKCRLQRFPVASE